MNRIVEVAGPSRASGQSQSQSRTRNRLVAVAAAIATIGASVSWAAPAGAAASLTATYDPATCDLRIEGSGFLADAGISDTTDLAITLLDSSDPVVSAYQPWLYTEIPAVDIQADGTFTFVAPSMVEFVTDAPPLISVVPADVEGVEPVTVTAPASPCVAQDVFLDATGTVIGGNVSQYGVSGEFVLPVWGMVDGFACRFAASVAANADMMAAISQDHAAGTCIAPAGQSLIGTSGSLQWGAPPYVRNAPYRAGFVTPIDVSAIECADGTCVVRSDILSNQIATTTTTTTTTATTSTTTTTAPVTTTSTPTGPVTPRFTG